jgi:hypothetical protein
MLLSSLLFIPLLGVLLISAVKSTETGMYVGSLAADDKNLDRFDR